MVWTTCNNNFCNHSRTSLPPACTVLYSLVKIMQKLTFTYINIPSISQCKSAIIKLLQFLQLYMSICQCCATWKLCVCSIFHLHFQNSSNLKLVHIQQEVHGPWHSSWWWHCIYTTIKTILHNCFIIPILRLCALSDPKMTLNITSSKTPHTGMCYFWVSLSPISPPHLLSVQPFCSYSQTTLLFERPLLWEATCLERPDIPGRRSYTFRCNWTFFHQRPPVLRPHLFGRLGWSLKTGSTVLAIRKKVHWMTSKWLITTRSIAPHIPGTCVCTG